MRAAGNRVRLSGSELRELPASRRRHVMLTYLLDWLGLLLRWLHLVAGIAWIGASFYFVWLDNHLQVPAARERSDPGIAGELWAVHGGGFYRSQKYQLAPEVLPATLHWFYWEAYTTWLSGFALLCLLYFFRAEAYLIDPAVTAMSKPMAIGIALGFLIASWLIYDSLCRSPLGRHARALTALIGLVLALEAWGLCQLFSGRGAFMVFGSALGSIMVANVLFVIIPDQRELVRAKQQGRAPDPAAGLRGKQRSVHNTYFTLPVLFVMISNHYAMTFGARYNWLVLIAISFAGACIRAWFVARHRAAERGGYVPALPALPALLGVLALAAVMVALAPAPGRGAADTQAMAAAGGLSRVQQIVQLRCLPCHAAKPTQAGFSAAPNGLVLETLDQLSAHLPEVQQQLSARTMPLGNLTAMTEDERSAMLMWIGHGARR
jgi:uncharacterized membrane protein